jgi:hypothetical protein
MTTTTTEESDIGRKSGSSSKNPPQAKTVYQLIAAVAGELAQAGISKNQRNQNGAGYNFRGIDDVYNAVGPILAKHGLVILPRCITRECVERTSGKGTALLYVTVEAEFDFVSSHDGSKHTVVMFGEAMDTGDKATNKAMSAAYKYAMFQAFCIPTEGDNDADSSTHTVAARTTNSEPIEYLSEAQIGAIKTLADEVGADITAIMKFYNAPSLDRVSSAAYQSIIRSLEKKRKPAEQDASTKE